MTVPVPSKLFLDQWFKDFKTTPGIQHQMLELLKSKFENEDPLEREAVIVFDEMDLKEEYVFDPTTRKVFKAYKKAQTVIVRGLAKPWKQVIYYQYDQNMTKKLLLEIIEQCEKSNIKIRGVAFDMGNHTFIKEVKLISQNKHYFQNPADRKRKVYLFPDVPHMGRRKIVPKPEFINEF